MARNGLPCGRNSVVECQLPKLDVAGSNPVARFGRNTLAERKLNVPVCVGQSGLQPLEARKTSAERVGAMPRRNHVPTYRLHKQSGQAIVTLPDGFGSRRDILLGKYGSIESRLEYARVLAEWEAGSRRLPQTAVPTSELTINEVLVQYYLWAKQHYRDAEGQLSREWENLQDALRPLRCLYGHMIARSFGPLALRRSRMRWSNPASRAAWLTPASAGCVECSNGPCQWS